MLDLILQNSTRTNKTLKKLSTVPSFIINKSKMSLEDQTNLEDNNQKKDHSRVQQEEHGHTTTTTSSTTSSDNTVTSISVEQGESTYRISSPQESPLRPVTSHSPMTSTPLLLTNSSSNSKTKSSSHEAESSKIVSQNNHYNSSTDERSSSSAINTVEVLPSSTSTTQQIHHQSRNSVQESTKIASSSSSNNVDHSAITIIQVQSNNSQRIVQDTQETTTTVKRTSMQETDLDIDVDGLAVTRIRLTGEKSPSPENDVVKVTVLNGSSGHNIIDDGDGQITPTNGEDADDGRCSIRFDNNLGVGVGGLVGSQPSDLNDTVSEMSSVVNNPSVISQLPDRYGFMGGEQFTHESEPDPSPEIVRRREMKWLHMIDKWDHFMRKDFKTVRSRCRKGIPRSVRGRAWYYLCGAAFVKKKDPDLFFKLLQQEGRTSDIEDIKKDLHRQFPWHEIFAEEGHGKKDLFNVLKAHSILNSHDGYCQAQAPIASILLMHMPAEDAFWCLVAICDKYLKGYYSHEMEQLKLDGDILFGLLKRIAPPVYKHMKKQKIDPVLYMTEWFLCAFTRTLPWSSVLRVWDSFLCEGVKVLFRVGLILLKYTLGRPGILKQCPSMYETLSMLKNLPNYVTHEQFLVAQIQRMDVSDDQMRREHYKQSKKRKKAAARLEEAKRQQERNAANSRRPGQNNPGGTYRSHETSL